MSYKSNNNKSSASKKPFCKVCHDAGKTEAEYTSHFVRSLPDFNGNTKVTCPILAATECRYCYKLGHTTKFCPVIEENNKRAKKEKSVAIQAHKSEQRAAYAVKPVAAPVSNKFAGAFAALADESDDEKPEPKQVVAVVDDFPALFGLKKEATPVAKSAVSWAAMAEKPAAPVLKLIVKPTPQIVTKKWADYSDSDTEEDEEEEIGTPLVRTDSVYNNAPCYASRSSWEDDDW